MNLIKDCFSNRRNYLLIFTFIAFLFSAINLIDLFVENYNQQIVLEELNKKSIYNKDKSYGIIVDCNFGAPNRYIQNKFINFVVFSFSFLILLINKSDFKKIFYSFFLLIFSLIHFAFWFKESYSHYATALMEGSPSALWGDTGEYPNGHFSFPFRYLEYSNYLDFVSLVLLSILILWEVSVLYAFATERFQAKISVK